MSASLVKEFKDDIFFLDGLNQHHVSVICMIIQSLEDLTIRDNKWFSIEEFYNALNTHPFSKQDVKNEIYYTFSLRSLTALMPMISLLGAFEKNSDNKYRRLKNERVCGAYLLNN